MKIQKPVTSRTIEVQAPPGAEVWCDDTPVPWAGGPRVFTSPALERGAEHVYVVRARWSEGGRAVEQMQAVPVRAGGNVQLQFPRP